MHRISGPAPRFAEETWRAAFLAMVKVGLPAYLAAEACGVSRQTYFMWARKGGHPDFTESADWVSPDNADPEYHDFILEVLSTEANSLHKVTETVYQKAESDPEFGLKVLRHRWPEFWNPSRNAAPTVVMQDSPKVQMTFDEFRRMQQQDDDDD